MPQQSILFVCIGNACRSQMAEGWAKHMSKDNLRAYSAGSHPAGFVAEKTVLVMKEKAIDISKHYSKGIVDLPKIQFDYVVTMGCGDACPLVPAKKRFDWKIPDPIGHPIEYYREVRDLVEEKVRAMMEELKEE